MLKRMNRSIAILLGGTVGLGSYVLLVLLTDLEFNMFGILGTLLGGIM